MAVSRVRTGVILVVFGVLLLMNTTGVIDVSVWRVIGVWWPVFLIAIGLEKIFSASRILKPLAYLSPVIIIATVAYAVLTTNGTGIFADGGSGRNVYEWSVPRSPDIRFVDLTMDFKGGRIKLRGGAAPETLLEGQFYRRGHKPQLVSQRQQGDTMRISLRSVLGGKGRHLVLGQRDMERWVVKLNEAVPVKLTLDAGAARVRLDMADIALSRLDLSGGAADIDLILGTKSPSVDCDISGGAASIDIMVPQGAGLRIDQKTALASLSTGDLKLDQQGSRLETPGFDTEPVRITLRIDAAVSSLRIRESGPAAESNAI